MFSRWSNLGSPLCPVCDPQTHKITALFNQRVAVTFDVRLCVCLVISAWANLCYVTLTETGSLSIPHTVWLWRWMRSCLYRYVPNVVFVWPQVQVLSERVYPELLHCVVGLAKMAKRDWLDGSEWHKPSSGIQRAGVAVAGGESIRSINVHTVYYTQREKNACSIMLLYVNGFFCCVLSSGAGVSVSRSQPDWDWSLLHRSCFSSVEPHGEPVSVGWNTSSVLAYQTAQSAGKQEMETSK